MDYNDGLPALFLGAGFISLHHLFCILFLILPLRHDRVSHARCTLCSVSGVYRFSFLSSWAWSLYVCVFFSYTISSMPIDSFILFFAGDCHPFETLQYSYCIHLGLLRIHASLPPPSTCMCALPIRNDFRAIFRAFKKKIPVKIHNIVLCILCVNVCNFRYCNKWHRQKDEIVWRSDACFCKPQLYHTFPHNHHNVCKNIYFSRCLFIRSNFFFPGLEKFSTKRDMNGWREEEEVFYTYFELNSYSTFHIFEFTWFCFFIY